ncbi:DUF3572 family protein [Paraurantiacibacter namhicola]|uniref:DUF3572 domain-containing protein n=1 Tax=Paraurantiacibacter namhicola TaxID=645517 RepID=A0A1C7D5I0_9SPHN|nr:DUF3572 family protein [Paraurantiacibacter namhicola]ANU06581.1 hypothetical protein A6F65_00254 [Paraurantiacibacter namhicola]
MTIANRPADASADPAQLALQALAWALEEERRAQRLLDLTGLTPDDLRTRLDTAAVQGAILDFLMAHEPDLLAAAAAMGVEPAAIPAARERIDR